MLFGFGVLLSGACSQKPTQVNQANVYFNLDSLVSAQVDVLTKTPVSLEKWASVDSKEEFERLTYDSSGWAGELALFRAADISKPVYAGMYQKEAGLKDTNSNLFYDSYSSNASTTKVKSIRIYYLERPGNIKRIEIEQLEDNILYFSKRNLTMTFQTWKNGNMLDIYQIEVVQKLPLQDSVYLSIKGEITLN